MSAPPLRGAPDDCCQAGRGNWPERAVSDMVSTTTTVSASPSARSSRQGEQAESYGMERPGGERNDGSAPVPAGQDKCIICVLQVFRGTGKSGRCRLAGRPQPWGLLRGRRPFPGRNAFGKMAGSAAYSPNPASGGRAGRAADSLARASTASFSAWPAWPSTHSRVTAWRESCRERRSQRS